MRLHKGIVMGSVTSLCITIYYRILYTLVGNYCTNLWDVLFTSYRNYVGKGDENFFQRKSRCLHRVMKLFRVK